MAQTTDAMSGVDCPIEFTADGGTTWVNISGSTNSIEPSAQTRMTGVSYTLDGKNAIITGGKREPVEIEVKILFTPTDGQAYQTAQDVHDDDGQCGIRWSPQGGAVGHKRYTAFGIMSEFLHPRAMAEEATPIPGMFKVLAPQVVESTIAS